MKKVLSTIIAVCMLCAIGTIASAACRGWGGWQLSVMDRFVEPNSSPNATARLTRCSCLPVDNHLKVQVQAQYKIGENGTLYYWSPGSTSAYYVTSEQGNANSVTATATVPDYGFIIFAKANYEATCGNDPTSYFTREWSGDPGEAFAPEEK